MTWIIAAIFLAGVLYFSLTRNKYYTEYISTKNLPPYQENSLEIVSREQLDILESLEKLTDSGKIIWSRKDNGTREYCEYAGVSYSIFSDVLYIDTNKASATIPNKYQCLISLYASIKRQREKLSKDFIPNLAKNLKSHT